MSLFDKLNNKRYDLQEKKEKKFPSDSSELKKGKLFSKKDSDAIQSRSANRDAKKYASGEYPKIGGGERMSPKSKGPGASTGGTKIPPATVGGKSKGTTPVKINITKPVKQSEVSKKAKEFTTKVNKANVNRKEFEYAKSKESKTFKGTVTQGANKGRSYTITRNPPPKGIDKNLNKAEVKLRDAKSGRNMKTGRLSPISQDLGKRAARGEPKAVQFTIDQRKDYRRGRGLGKRAERKFDASGGKKTGTLRKGNISFPGDRTGAYSRAKNQLDFDKALKKARGGTTGDIAPEAPKSVKDYAKGVRDKRIKKLKLPDTSFSAKTKFSQKDFQKSLGGVKKSTTAAPGLFGSGDTPGQTKIKAMDAKAFKVTKPSDIKLPQSSRNFDRIKKEYRADAAKTSSTTGPRKITKKFTPTVGVKQSEVSKNQKEFTKAIDKARTKTPVTSSKTFSKFAKEAETATTNLRKQVDTIAKNPKLTGSQKAEQSRKVMKNLKTSQNFARGLSDPKKAQTAITLPKDIKTVQSAAKSPITKPSSKTVSQIMKQNTIRVGPTGRVKTKGPQLLDDITVKNVPREIRFGKASSKVLAKTPKALKPVARPALKLLAKAGAPGRIAAAGLGVAALSPAARKAAGQLATGVGLTALFGRGKKDKQLKVGDGLTKVSNMPSKYQPKGMKSGTFKEPGSNKVRGTGDVRVRFDLASGGGKVRNPKDVARVKNIQKNYIDDYNKKAAKNPFKKAIKYDVNKDGTYTVKPLTKKK